MKRRKSFEAGMAWHGPANRKLSSVAKRASDMMISLLAPIYYVSLGINVKDPI
jgi:hypothetical protein